MVKHKTLLALLLTAAVLSGCTAQAAQEEVRQETAVPVQTEETLPPETLPPETLPVAQEAQAMAEEPPPPAVPVVLEPVASGEKTDRCETAEVDYSHTGDGYVMVRFTGDTEKRLKVLLKGPTTTYNYNLPKGEWTVFPLSDGSGAYQLGIYQNVSGKQYATVMVTEFSAELTDEFAPFLRPNQYVNFSEATRAVAKGLEVTEGREQPLEKVEAVYDFVVAALSYDDEKASTVKSGYLPVLDEVLESGKGICFDYAALMTAMLRSQEIPCKLVVGYAGSTYHAWISVWTEESGWVDGAIFFDGHQWKRMDPTFASSSGGDEKILDFIQNGKYKVKYLY
ncbi:MAG: transglutaminase domain-containing protein [Oscillospiraceae bacterium]|nr:transglutaminase domain-containing protein [Oscillospiraceae bacterium]